MSPSSPLSASRESILHASEESNVTLEVAPGGTNGAETGAQRLRLELRSDLEELRVGVLALPEQLECRPRLWKTANSARPTLVILLTIAATLLVVPSDSGSAFMRLRTRRQLH
ncbi:hypothetical protein BKA62DRAFT_778465 [Auriculariales sp. MPI-PUGE-AT-0066]|nr:hypothetical protein BKA62DRAFT_778465 [Auriculariales sp. MPI-PUGE-AT-0066]